MRVPTLTYSMTSYLNNIITHDIIEILTYSMTSYLDNIITHDIIEIGEDDVMPRGAGTGTGTGAKKKRGPSRSLSQRSNLLSPDLGLPALTHPGRRHRMPGIPSDR